MSRDRDLGHAVAQLAGARIETLEPVGGGSIASAALGRLTDGRGVFLKVYRTGPPDIALREAAGLTALDEAGALRVPRDVQAGGGSDGVPPFLVMEAVDQGAARRDTFERFGRALAALHRATEGERYGLDHDNYLGRTAQPNGWDSDWLAFWRRQRLGHQLQLARLAKLDDPQLRRLGERLSERLDRWLPAPGEGACLLHGDLWSGNYLVGADGEVVLIDPAIYHGQREAELAMTRLFGGFPPAFYAAYEEAWPLPPGSQERIAIYQLYHVLNHLNLFGRGYRDQAVTLLGRLVG